jgi:uncharacterized integral membrane protein (TIGR00697 family)
MFWNRTIVTKTIFTQRIDLERLYIFITTAFCVIVVISNIISSKLFRVPFFENFSIPTGLITYPLTFLLSDLVTELYGAKSARTMIYMALLMSLLSYSIIQIALTLPTTHSENQRAFEAILGLNGLTIFASISAYVISQLIDIQIYASIKTITGDRLLWLRNNVSTLISQIADTITVNLIHLYWGLGLDFQVVLKIMIFSYVYKAFFSILSTPLFYLSVSLVKHYTYKRSI